MEAVLFNPDPSAYLPHRPPFLFIERIVALEPGVAATGELAVAAAGYFPPLLLVEAMAQAGGIAAAAGKAEGEGEGEGEGGMLAALERVELPVSVDPQAKYLVYSRIIKNFGRLILVKGEVRKDDVLVASAILTLSAGR